MNISIENPEAIKEIELLMERLNLSAQGVVERVMVEMGAWVPFEALSHAASGMSKQA